METLQITDGTTTFDFAGVDAHIQRGGWAPRLPMSRRGIMGGGDPNGEVEEVITFQIIGDDEADALANLGKLNGLMQQAVRFGRGENVTAVLLKYRKTGSNLANPVQAVILGGPANGREYLELPDDYDFPKEGAITPITLYLRRRATWLAASDTEAKSAAASSGNPAVMTLSSAFTNNTKVLSPFDLQLAESVGGRTFTTTQKGYVIVVNDSSKLIFVESEDGLYESGTYQVDTVVAAASAGNVTNYKGTMTGGVANALYTRSAAQVNASDAPLWASFVCVHNLSTTHTWYMRPYARMGVLTITGRISAIDPTTYASPQVISLGLISVPPKTAAGHYFGYQAWIDSAGATPTDDLQIDYFCFVALDDATRIIYSDSIFEPTASDNFLIQHQLNSKQFPLVFNSPGTTYDQPLSYRGDSLFAATGNSLSCIVLGNDGAGTWVIEASIGEISIIFTATRMEGYLAPP